MNIVLMQEQNDCHNAVIGTACEVDYDEASKATGHINLPSMLESPIFSNPANMYLALIRLGFWKKNITWTDLESGNYAPGKTIVLLHNPENPLLAQHWIVLGERGSFGYKCFWGDKAEPRTVSQEQLKQYFLKGWPNCAFQVYKANAIRLFWERLKGLFNR